MSWAFQPLLQAAAQQQAATGGDTCSLPTGSLTLTPRTPSATTTSAPGLLNFYGFESQNTGDEVSGLIYTGSFSGIDGSAGRRTGFGLLMDIGLGGNGTFRIGRHDYVTGRSKSIGLSELYLTFWVRVSILPTSETLELAYARDGGGSDKWKLTIDGDGNLDLLDATGSGIFGSTEKITVGTWRKIELYTDSSATGTVRLKYYEGASLTPIYDSGNTSADTGGSYDYVALGSFTGTSGGAVEFHYDDVILHGSQFYSDGHYRVAALTPNGAGDVAEWTAGTGASDYTQVDELPTNAADYIKSTTSAGKKSHLVNLLPRSGDTTYGNTIKGVKVFAQLREDTAGTSEDSIVVKTNGGDFYSVPVDLDTTDTAYYGFWPTNPITGADFTAAEIDALQIGVAEFEAIAVRANSMAAFVLIRETQTSALPTPATLVTTSNTPSATTSSNNKSAIPLGTLTATALTPSATTTTVSGNVCDMPAGSLTASAQTPGAATTNNHMAAVPLGTLSATANTPGAATTNAHKVAVPLGSLTATGQTPSASTTNANKSAVPLGSLNATTQTPTATTTNGHKAALPLGTLTATGNSPAATTTEHNKTALSLGTLTVTANDPGAVTTEQHKTALPLGTLTVTGNIPQSTVGQSNTSAIPAASVTLTGLTPGGVTTERHNAGIPLGTVTATGNAPGAATTEHNHVGISTATLTATGAIPGAITTEHNKSGMPAGALTATGNAPTFQTTEFVDNVCDMPAGVLTLSEHTPGATLLADSATSVPSANVSITGNALSATTTEHHKAAIPHAIIDIIEAVPTFVTTGLNFVQLPVAGIDLTGFAFIAETTESAGNVLKWYTGADFSGLPAGKTVTKLEAGGDISELYKGNEAQKTFASGTSQNDIF